MTSRTYEGRSKQMKSTGIVRKVDELGRVVLPIELRRTLDINEKDSLEIFVDGTFSACAAACAYGTE